MTKLKLFNIYRSQILLENRIDDAKALAQKKGLLDNFDEIVNISKQINPNHKYLNFIIKNFENIRQDIDNAIEILTYFERNTSKFEKKDINQYTSFNELLDAVEKAKHKKRRDIDIIEGARVIYDTDDFVVLVPETKAASCYYGLGSTWCTANSKKKYYEDYRRYGELYYIISRVKPTSHCSYKMAVRMIVDFMLDNPLPFPKIAEIRDARNNKITEEILIQDSSPEVLKVIKKDFEQKLEEWWNFITKNNVPYDAVKSDKEHRLYLLNSEIIEKLYALQAFLFPKSEINTINIEKTKEIIEKIETFNYKGFILITNNFNFNNFDIDEETHNRLSKIINDLYNLKNQLHSRIKSDISNLYLEPYEYYGLTVITDKNNGTTWAIGTDGQAYDAAYQYLREYIEKHKYEPGMGISDYYINQSIDSEAVIDDFRSDIEYMIRKYPDNYIPDEYLELTDEGRELLEEKENQLNELYTQEYEIKEQINKIQKEMKDLDLDSDEYYKFEEQLSDLNSELENIKKQIHETESEMEKIQNTYLGYSDETIEEFIEKKLDEIRDDPLQFLHEYDITNISRYVDTDKLVNDIIEDNGRGRYLSLYNNEEYTIDYNGTEYFIYRLN